MTLRVGICKKDIVAIREYIVSMQLCWRLLSCGTQSCLERL